MVLKNTVLHFLLPDIQGKVQWTFILVFAGESFCINFRFCDKNPHRLLDILYIISYYRNKKQVNRYNDRILRDQGKREEKHERETGVEETEVIRKRRAK